MAKSTEAKRQNFGAFLTTAARGYSSSADTILETPLTPNGTTAQNLQRLLIFLDVVTVLFKNINKGQA